MKEKPDQLNLQIDQQLQEHYKLLFTRVVLRVMLVTSIILFATHLRFDSPRFQSGMLVLVLIVIINVYLTTRNRPIKTPWGTIQSRSEEIDTLRWCINFPLDIYIFWSLDLSLVLVVAVWLLLTFAAMTDVYEKRNKLITLSFAFISFVFLITVISPTDLKTAVYLIAVYIGLVYIFWSLERFVFDGIAQIYKGELQRKHIEKEAQELQREAAVGRTTRSLSHELNTLLSVAGLSAERIRRKPDDTAKDLDRLDKSFSYMSKVSTLILDDLGNTDAPIRQISLAELLQDVRLLLCNDSSECQTMLEFDFPPNPEKYNFQERTGSTYLIINNLVKNAHEAILEKFSNKPGGVIKLRANVLDNKIVISVSDNGIGMTAVQLDDIQKQKAISSKISGHGLGLQFVQRECELNGFELAVSSELGSGSEFVISGFQ